MSAMDAPGTFSIERSARWRELPAPPFECSAYQGISADRFSSLVCVDINMILGPTHRHRLPGRAVCIPAKPPCTGRHLASHTFRDRPRFRSAPSRRSMRIPNSWLCSTHQTLGCRDQPTLPYTGPLNAWTVTALSRSCQGAPLVTPSIPRLPTASTCPNRFTRRSGWVFTPMRISGCQPAGCQLQGTPAAYHPARSPTTLSRSSSSLALQAGGTWRRDHVSVVAMVGDVTGSLDVALRRTQNPAKRATSRLQAAANDGCVMT